jgi:hypothetical protein
VLLVYNLPRLARATLSKAKGAMAKAQFYIALAIMLLLFAYMVILFGTTAMLVWQAIRKVLDPAAPPVSSDQLLI